MNITGIFAYFKAVKLKGFLKNGNSVQFEINAIKLNANSEHLGFLDMNSAFYQRYLFPINNSTRKKGKNVPFQPVVSFSPNKPTQVSFYFGTTCQRESCKYFALAFRVHSQSEESQWIQFTDVFIVQSKNSGGTP